MRKLRRFESFTRHVKIPGCIVCRKELENIADMPQVGDINQPNGGLTFMTHGHYGSSQFDSVNPDRWLEVNICDECIADRRDLVLHVTKLPQSFTTPVMMEPWNPYKHGG